MRSFRARINPLSAFGTLPKGDTLFGQLCWAVRNRHGVERLNSLLDGYIGGRPFAVVSDALPADHLPRPILPGHWFDEIADEDRKTVKKRVWLPLEHLQLPVATWLEHCRPSSAVPGGDVAEHPQPHNTLNRRTGTTGEDQFAPYSMGQLWYGNKERGKVTLDIYCVIDEARFCADDLREVLQDIGALGFGRDASIGLGKFQVETYEAFDLPAQDNNANAWLTLAPCAPQGLPWQSDRCFYQPFTRFGRHGDVAVHGQGGPFKTPVLLANTGAVFTPQADAGMGSRASFTGQGLGGDGSLSQTIPGTVHQGYAPVVAIRLPESGETV